MPRGPEALCALAREAARGLPGDPEDVQSRYSEAAAGGVRVGCLYLPNGSPAPGPKFDYKLRWFDRLHAYAAALVAKPEPVVLAGDYNVIPEERDVYWPESWVGDALFRPESRAAYRRLLAQGWTDALRHLHPSERVYTFWEYTRGAWGRNAGLRIDHLLLNPAAARRLVVAGGGPGCARVGEDERPRPHLGRTARRKHSPLCPPRYFEPRPPPHAGVPRGGRRRPPH